MTKGFPNTILGLPIGWKKLGKMGSFSINKDSYYAICLFCKKRLRIGKENNVIFKYCPRCKKKLI